MIIHEAAEENQRQNNALKTAALGAGAGLAGGAYAASPHGQNMINRIGQGLSNMTKPNVSGTSGSNAGNNTGPDNTTHNFSNRGLAQSVWGPNQQQNKPTVSSNINDQFNKEAADLQRRYPSQDATTAIPNQVAPYTPRDILSSGQRAGQPGWLQNAPQAAPATVPVSQATQTQTQAEPSNNNWNTNLYRAQNQQPAAPQPEVQQTTPQASVNGQYNRALDDLNRVQGGLTQQTGSQAPNYVPTNSGGQSASGRVVDTTINEPPKYDLSGVDRNETATSWRTDNPSPFGPRVNDQVQLGNTTHIKTNIDPYTNGVMGGNAGTQYFNRNGGDEGYLDGIQRPSPFGQPEQQSDPSVFDKIYGKLSGLFGKDENATPETPVDDGESWWDKFKDKFSDYYKSMQQVPKFSGTAPKIDIDDYT